MKCQLREFADKLGLDGDLQMNSPHDKSVTENLWALARISFSLGVISMALIVLAVLSGMEPQINHYSVEDLAVPRPMAAVHVADLLLEHLGTRMSRGIHKPWMEAQT